MGLNFATPKKLEFEGHAPNQLKFEGVNVPKFSKTKLG